MLNGKEVTFQGEGWRATVDQFSNKGPVIIVEDKDGEIFRVLYDTVTSTLRVLPGGAMPGIDITIGR